MIYLIGGTPRAGKTTLAKKLVEKNAIPFLSTDVVLHMVSDTLPELNLLKPYAEIPAKFFPYMTNLIEHLQKTIKDYAIEGDAFSPAHVAEFQKKYEIRACFLGFSKTTLKEIEDHVGENDWLDDLSPSDRENLPQWIMEKSGSIKQECATHGIRYFDMAGGVYDQNLEKAYDYLVKHTST